MYKTEMVQRLVLNLCTMPRRKMMGWLGGAKERNKLLGPRRTLFLKIKRRGVRKINGCESRKPTAAIHHTHSLTRTASGKIRAAHVKSKPTLLRPMCSDGTSAACGAIPKLVCFLRLLVQSRWVEVLQRVGHRLGLLQDSECYRSVRRCCVADNGWRLPAVILAVAGMVISARVTNHEDVAMFECLRQGPFPSDDVTGDAARA